MVQLQPSRNAQDAETTFHVPPAINPWPKLDTTKPLHKVAGYLFFPVMFCMVTMITIVLQIELFKINRTYRKRFNEIYKKDGIVDEERMMMHE